MGNKGSSPRAEVFTLRSDLPEDKRGPVLGAYVDYLQFPLSGIIGISRHGTVLINTKYGRVREFQCDGLELCYVDEFGHRGDSV